MRKSTGILMLLVGLFAGVIGGFLIAPIKNGMCIGSHNGNYYDKKTDAETKECNETEEYDECEDDIAF